MFSKATFLLLALAAVFLVQAQTAKQGEGDGDDAPAPVQRQRRHLPKQQHAKLRSPYLAAGPFLLPGGAVPEASSSPFVFRVPHHRRRRRSSDGSSRRRRFLRRRPVSSASVHRSIHIRRSLEVRPRHRPRRPVSIRRREHRSKRDESSSTLIGLRARNFNKNFNFVKNANRPLNATLTPHSCCCALIRGHRRDPRSHRSNRRSRSRRSSATDPRSRRSSRSSRRSGSRRSRRSGSRRSRRSGSRRSGGRRSRRSGSDPRSRRRSRSDPSRSDERDRCLPCQCGTTPFTGFTRVGSFEFPQCRGLDDLPGTDGVRCTAKQTCHCEPHFRRRGRIDRCLPTCFGNA